MQASEWAMLIFAAIGIASGLVYAGDRYGVRDRLGIRGRPGAALAFAALLGVIGAAFFASDEASVAGVLFWLCLTTGALVIGFVVALAGAELRDHLR